MKVRARTHTVGITLYSLPFLAVIIFSLFYMWAGGSEMIITGVALLPALLYFFGVRWCRYVVGGFSVISFLVCSMIPLTRGSGGRYFWLIWTPIWLIFAISSVLSFIPARQAPPDAP